MVFDASTLVTWVYARKVGQVVKQHGGTYHNPSEATMTNSSISPNGSSVTSGVATIGSPVKWTLSANSFVMKPSLQSQKRAITGTSGHHPWRNICARSSLASKHATHQCCTRVVILEIQAHQCCTSRHSTCNNNIALVAALWGIWQSSLCTARALTPHSPPGHEEAPLP